MAEVQLDKLVDVTSEQNESLRRITGVLLEEQKDSVKEDREDKEEKIEDNVRRSRTEKLLEQILDGVLKLRGGDKESSSGGFFSKALFGGLGVAATGLATGVLGPLRSIVSFFGAIKPALAPVVAGLRSIGLTGLSGATGIIGKIFMPVHVIISAFRSLMSAFDTESIATKLDKDISEVTNVDRLLEGLGKFLTVAVGGLIDPILKLFGIDFSVESILDKGFGAINKLISDATKAHDNGNLTGFIESIWTNITDSLKKDLEMVSTSVTDSMRSVVDGFIDWIRDADWVPDFVKSKLPMTAKREAELEVIRNERNRSSVAQAKRNVSIADDSLKQLKEQEDASLQSYGVMFQQQIEQGIDPDVALRQYEENVSKTKEMYSSQRNEILKDREKNSEIIKNTEVREIDNSVINNQSKDNSVINRIEVDNSRENVTSSVSSNSSPIVVRQSSVNTVNEGTSNIMTANTGDVDTDALLDMIGKKESNNNYNALVYGNGTPKSANLTNMTIGDVVNYQNGMISRGHASTAVGKYQFIKATLLESAKASGLDMSDKFSPENQDKMAMYLLNRRGLKKLQAGEISQETFAANLSKEWASIPTVTGKSYYEGIAGNTSSGTYSELMDVIGGGTSSTDSSRTVRNPDGGTSQRGAVSGQGSQPAPINSNSMKLDPGQIEISLRNDEPSFKKVIEELAFNSMGKTGSPLSV